MNILIIFKDGEELRRADVKQVFCNPKEDALILVYAPFSADNFNLSEISFYNVEKNNN